MSHLPLTSAMPVAWERHKEAPPGQSAVASIWDWLCTSALEGLEPPAASALVHATAPPATGRGPGGTRELCQSSRPAFAPFQGFARALSALVGRTACSQCAPANGEPGNDETVRCTRRLCYLAR